MLFQLGWPLDYCFTHPPPSETGFILLAQAPALWDGCGMVAWISKLVIGSNIFRQRLIVKWLYGQMVDKGCSKDVPDSFSVNHKSGD
jgi:hypothetical protein